MGGLRKYMPITWLTSLAGSLALIGTPFFAGFYSKDSIIEAVQFSNLPGAGFAYFAVIVGVFVTAFYSFRMYFLVFHGKERFSTEAAHGHDAHHGHDDHGHGGLPHESPAVVTIPLILLAIPSVVIGYLAIDKMLFGDFFNNVIFVDSVKHPSMAMLHHHFHSAADMGIESLTSLPFILALSGVVVAWFFYLQKPAIPAAIKARCGFLYTLLDNKYYLDVIYYNVFARGSRLLGTIFWKAGDVLLIDTLVVNGAAKTVGWFSTVVRRLQSGYIYHYAFAMIIGALALLLYTLRLVG